MEIDGDFSGVREDVDPEQPEAGIVADWRRKQIHFGEREIRAANSETQFRYDGGRMRERAERASIVMRLPRGIDRASHLSVQCVLLPWHLIDWNGCHTILQVFAAVIDGSAVFFLTHQHDGNAEPRLHVGDHQIGLTWP